MRIIEDIGLKGFLGRTTGVRVCSQADVMSAEEPLLIFAHTGHRLFRRARAASAR